MRNFFCFLIIVLQLYLAFRYDYSPGDYILLLFNCIGTFIFFKNIKIIKNSLAILFLFLFIIFSLHLEAYLQVEASSFVLFNSGAHEKVFCSLAIFSNELLSVFYLSFFLLHQIIGHGEGKIRIKKKIIENRSFNLIIIFSYVISLVSGYLGVGKMGYEANIVLPFHLNGMMQFYRTDIFPLLFALYVYDRITSNMKVPISQIILVVMWAVLESFVRFSRSAVVMSFLPLIFMLLYSGNLHKKMFVKIVIPILLLGYLLFPIITAVRETGKMSSNTINSSVSEKDDNLQHMYLRTFYSGLYFMRLYPNGYDDPSTFYFERFPSVLLLGGSAVYTTRIVDGVTENVIHSSGTTGILDPVIIGGKGLCFVVLFLLVLLGLILDKRIEEGNVMYKVVLLVMFKMFVMQKNLTVFLDSEAIQVITSYALQFIIVSYYYRNYFTNKKNIV